MAHRFTRNSGRMTYVIALAAMTVAGVAVVVLVAQQSDGDDAVPADVSPSTAPVGPAWLAELPENVQAVARAVVSGDRATLEQSLHFRSEAGFSIFHAWHCQGGSALQTPDEVLELLVEISLRHGVLAEAVRAKEDVQSSNVVHFLVFHLQTPEEPRTVVVDDTGVIAIFDGCGQNADFFAGNGNATVWH